MKRQIFTYWSKYLPMSIGELMLMCILWLSQNDFTIRSSLGHGSRDMHNLRKWSHFFTVCSVPCVLSNFLLFIGLFMTNDNVCVCVCVSYLCPRGRAHHLPILNLKQPGGGARL